jgi:hypothetical protein
MAEDTITIFIPGAEWFAIVKLDEGLPEERLEVTPILFWRVDYGEKGGAIQKISAVVWSVWDKEILFDYDYQTSPGFQNFVYGKPAKVISPESALEKLTLEFGLTTRQIERAQKDRRGQMLIDILAKQKLLEDIEDFDQEK